MDEIELVAALRPDPTPDPETVTRHRAQLRAAIDAARPQPGAVGGTSTGPDEAAGAAVVLEIAGDGVPPVARSRRRVRWLAAAAAVAVMGGLVLAADRIGGSDGRQVTATDDQNAVGIPSDGADPAAAATAETSFACGPDMPIAVPVPDGFTGPVEGPGGDAPASPAADQRVLHWISDTGTIEVRWPGRGRQGDPGDWGQVVDEPPVGDETEGSSAHMVITGVITADDQPEPTPSGRVVTGLAISFAGVVELPANDEAECQSLEITIAAADPEHVRELGSGIYAALFEPGGPFGSPVLPLVTESTSADAPPEIPPCQAPPGVPHNDFSGGPVEGLGTFPTPAEALEAFIATRTTTWEDPFGFEVEMPMMAEGGYTEIHLPDGSIAFALGVGEAGTTVVRVVEVDGGWTVDRWDATGC
ncbi:MAG: hypothetical protein ACRD29_23955 [Acidimicrobiales bacterium]